MKVTYVQWKVKIKIKVLVNMWLVPFYSLHPINSAFHLLSFRFRTAYTSNIIKKSIILLLYTYALYISFEF